MVYKYVQYRRISFPFQILHIHFVLLIITCFRRKGKKDHKFMHKICRLMFRANPKFYPKSESETWAILVSPTIKISEMSDKFRNCPKAKLNPNYPKISANIRNVRIIWIILFYIFRYYYTWHFCLYSAFLFGKPKPIV